MRVILFVVVSPLLKSIFNPLAASATLILSASISPTSVIFASLKEVAPSVLATVVDVIPPFTVKSPVDL